MAEVNYLEYWYQAMSARIGIVIETTNRKAFMQKLYVARRAACDESLNDLSVVESPTVETQVWLLKRKPDATP